MGPPGSYVAIQKAAPDRAMRLAGSVWIAPVDTASSSKLLIEDATDPTISPDGKLIAYVSSVGDRTEVFIQPIDGPILRRQASSGGCRSPVWSADGNELFYVIGGGLVAARIQRSPDLEVIQRDRLFSLADYQIGPNLYDVFPSGDEFLLVQSLGRGTLRLLARSNWFEELRRAEEAAVNP
jgi:hypothetical protein